MNTVILEDIKSSVEQELGKSIYDLITDFDAISLIGYISKRSAYFKNASDYSKNLLSKYILLLDKYRKPTNDLKGQLVNLSNESTLSSFINDDNETLSILMYVAFDYITNLYEMYINDFKNYSRYSYLLSTGEQLPIYNNYNSFMHIIGINQKALNDNLVHVISKKDHVDIRYISADNKLKEILKCKHEIICAETENINNNEELFLPYYKILFRCYILEKTGIKPNIKAVFNIKEGNFKSFHGTNNTLAILSSEEGKSNNGNFLIEGRIEENNEARLNTLLFITENKIIPYKKYNKNVSNIEKFTNMFMNNEPSVTIGYKDSNNELRLFDYKKVDKFKYDLLKDRYFQHMFQKIKIK